MVTRFAGALHWPFTIQYSLRVYLLGLMVCIFAPLWLQGCGGGGGSDSSQAVTGVATLDAAGGTVRGDDGVQVVFPAKALLSSVTVRIAKDSTGAPPLPPSVVAAGAAYTITPHGGAFSAHAEVSIPVQSTTLNDNEQLLLFTASPGDTQWTVLSDATYSNGMLKSSVMHFSIFMPVVIRNLQVPQLVVSVENMNNFGTAGVTLMSPDHIFENWGTQYETYRSGYHADEDSKLFLHYVARLRYPAQQISLKLLPALPVDACLPVNQGNSGASWNFYRGNQTLTPTVEHGTLQNWQSAEATYPPTEAGFQETSMRGGAGHYPEAGFGAVHFYGQDTPRRGALTSEVVALPPANNVADDDLLTWRGEVFWNAGEHNGRHRVDVWVPTTCGFSIAAAPLSYQLNLPDMTGRFIGVNSNNSPKVGAGSVATMEFYISAFSDISALTWEYSTDSINWQARPLPAEVRVTEIYDGSGYRTWLLVIDRATTAHTGFYRARACNQSIEGSPVICLLGSPSALSVVSTAPSFTQQPTALIVQLGETASFTAIPSGAPSPSLQWQRRSLQVAVAGNHAWTDIAGATGTTLTMPATTLEDSATQVRLVATNGMGVTASDAAMLTVLDRFIPPSVLSQPGSLNVVVGGTAVFASTVDGTAPLSYQWKRNGVAITGANGLSLTLNTVSAIDSARYELVISNRAGSVTTEPATLVVTLGAPVPLAPTIAAPPVSVSLTVGQTAQFAVAVNGTGPYTYQWSKDDSPIIGAEGPSLSIASVNVIDQGAYSVRVTNSVGTVVSAAASLSVNQATVTLTPPVIGTGPAGLAVVPGGGATFAVAVTGTGPFTFQWSRDGQTIVGATDAVLHLPVVNAIDAGQYSVEVSNAAGIAASSSAQLIVIGAPTLTSQPFVRSAAEGSSTTFSVQASGTALGYQWMRNQIAISGANSASYTTPTLAMSDSGAVYAVVVYNGAGVAISQGAMLTVTAAPPPPAPAGLTAKAVATGYGSSFAVDLDGTVWAWGNLVDPTTGGYKASSPFASRPVKIQGLSGVKSITAVSESAAFYALHDDGTVSAWGRNNAGQLGDRTTTTRNLPVPVMLDATNRMTGICKIAGGPNAMVMAPCTAGTVWMVGLLSQSNFGGDSAGGATANGALAKAIPGLPSNKVVKALAMPDAAANALGSLLIVYDNETVFAWGQQSSNTLGAGIGVTNVGTAAGPISVWAGMGSVESAELGRDFSIVQGVDFRLKSVGRNLEGQLGIGSYAAQTDRISVNVLDIVSRFSVGQADVAAIQDGQLWVWGWNNGRVLTQPTRLGSEASYTEVSMGDIHGLAIGAGGVVYAWGDGTYGALGNGQSSAMLPEVVTRP
jgi:hypothetical protein